MKFTCYGCSNRHAGCHATCETYRREKAEYEAQRAEMAKRKRVEKGLDDHKSRTISKIKRNYGRQWRGKETE